MTLRGTCCGSSVVEHSIGNGEVDSSILSRSTIPCCESPIFPVKSQKPMWTLIWGMEVNRILKTWNRETSASLDEAMQSAAEKMNNGYVAHAIISPEGVVHFDEATIKEHLTGGSKS
jgi:hypothetical protein